MAGVCAKQTLLRDSGAAQSIGADFGILMKDAIADMGGWSQIVARWIVDVKS